MSPPRRDSLGGRLRLIEIELKARHGLMLICKQRVWFSYSFLRVCYQLRRADLTVAEPLQSVWYPCKAVWQDLDSVWLYTGGQRLSLGYFGLGHNKP